MARFASKSIFCLIVNLIIAILLTLGFAAPLEAQSTSIRLVGHVWDTAGDALPGAALTAIEENTGRQYEAVSNDDGSYTFLALQPGTYSVSAKAKGLKDVVHRRISLLLPGTAEENFTFEVSAIDKEIGPRELPRLYDPGTSTSLGRRSLDAMPLLDRNPLALLAYQPGVQINGGNEGTSTVNGTRQAMNTIGMDGVSVTDPINPRMAFSLLPMSPEAIADIQIVTTGAKAEYGGSGGAQFMLVSRSGSKSWSGNLYDYFRTRRLNANDFFNNASGIPRPGLARNIFGATASGHVGNSTLAFVNFEGNHTDQQITRNRLVLTETAKTGVFRWYKPGDLTRDGTTLQYFDIAANDPRGLGIDPTIASIIDKLPESENTDLGDGLNTAGYRFDNPIYNRQKRVAVRIDHSRSKKHQLFLRFNWDRINATDVLSEADAPYADEPYGTFRQNNWGFVLGSDYTLNPQMVNEFRVGYLRPETEFSRPARTSDAMLLANSWIDPLDPSFPRSYDSPIFEITDNFTHGKGRHSLKYGFTFRRTLQSSTNYNGVYPNVTFGRSMGNAPATSIGPSSRSKISIDDRITFENLYNDLLGRIESVSQTFNSDLTASLPAGTPRIRDYAFQEYAAYVQDEWKIKSNLTLSLGLRYELSTVPKEKNGLQAVLDQVAQVSNSANISKFTVVSGSDWYPGSMKDFAPRIGFAWDAYSTGRTLIRGSYGIYYDRLIGAITNFMDENSYGFSQTSSLYPNSAGTDVRLKDGIPTIAQPPAANLTLPLTRSSSIAIFDPNLRTPRIHQFNVTLEKLQWGAVWEIGYVGSRGQKLFQYLNLNQTKTDGDFLEAFKELQAYRNTGTSVPSTNTLVRLFGSPLAAMKAIGGSNLDTGQVGLAADNLDRNFYGAYAAAGVSDFYLRNFPQFNKFIVGSSIGDSSYNALQMGVRKSGRSYQLRVNYALSKSRDTLSSDGFEYVAPPNSLDFKSDKTPSDFDRKHVLNVALFYSFPFVRNVDSDLPRWLTALLADWNLGAHWIRETGPRFSVTTDRETLYAGVKSLADYSKDLSIGGVNSSSEGLYWFNSEQRPLFTLPAAGGAGTSGRNSFIGQRYSNLDVSLFKSFPVRNDQNLQIRIEAYNAFNQTHFALPDTNRSSDTFGKITSTTGTPRTLQLALRYQF